MIIALALVVPIAPLAAAASCLLFRRQAVAEYANLAAGGLSLAAALPLPFLVMPKPVVFLGGYMAVDGLGAWVALCGALVYFLASIYAIGYMRMLAEVGTGLWRFYTLFAAFACTVELAPFMNNAGVYWIAVELTTLVSAFLVGYERAAESMEAAWKYIIVVSAGISLALLGTILLYWCGSFVLGPTYDMTWGVLREAAPKLNPLLLDISFLLLLVGYGTKAGLAPMHTWLPDAHSEGPAPVSAMLSGALLNTAMVGIVRALAITDRAAMPLHLPRTVLVVLGALSLLVGALFIVRQRGVKRLMAYSSVEHMGVVALGFGFGGFLGIAGALYHMLNHSLNKSLMFFGAGNVMRAFGSKDMCAIRGVRLQFPVMGTLWLAGAVAITGAPPFGPFLSELTVLRAGMESIHAWAAVVMLVLLVVIFIGFLEHFRAMYFSKPIETPLKFTRLSVWCVLPMWLALLPLLVLGLWWPDALHRLFSVIAKALAP